MHKRILSVHATRAGSTAEVAEAIGRVLATRRPFAQVKPARENPTLDSYDAVILGSAIRVGHWLPGHLSPPG
jgi:menaquinone-dependent protoporphyrinogen oxidase